MNQFSAITQPTAKSARIVSGLATLYYRHNDPARALALGLMAMRCGYDKPRTALLVASCFLKTGDPEQAEAALSRLKSQPLTQSEEAASAFLMAKVHFRRGDHETAQNLLAEAARLTEALL
ncbi:MAG: tetratricopeptide repeat protein [Pseudomonadota bacterium]